MTKNFVKYLILIIYFVLNIFFYFKTVKKCIKCIILRTVFIKKANFSLNFAFLTKTASKIIHLIHFLTVLKLKKYIL